MDGATAIPNLAVRDRTVVLGSLSRPQISFRVAPAVASCGPI
jgi:hypothetical protein